MSFVHSFSGAYNRRMIKADIVNKVAEVSEISRVKAAQAVEQSVSSIQHECFLSRYKADGQRRWFIPDRGYPRSDKLDRKVFIS